MADAETLGADRDVGLRPLQLRLKRAGLGVEAREGRAVFGHPFFEEGSLLHVHGILRRRSVGPTGDLRLESLDLGRQGSRPAPAGSTGPSR